MSLFTHEFILWPERWINLNLPIQLDWTLVPFEPGSRQSIAQLPGVYAFLIRPQTISALQLSYLMYVGMTDRTLRERFGEYLTESQSDRIRPKLLRVLPLFPGHLFFAFAPVPAEHSAEEIETSLIDAFVPPCNDDIDATLKRVKKAFK
jgi:hypothetical protein